MIPPDSESPLYPLHLNFLGRIPRVWYFAWLGKARYRAVYILENRAGVWKQ